MESEARIWVFVGEDDYLVENAAREVIAARVPADLRTNAVETVNGVAGNSEEQMASLKECSLSVFTPPFLDPVKLTWWRGVTFLPGGGRNGVLAENVKTALENFAGRLKESPLPANQFFIITATKLLATSIFAKTLTACGAEMQIFATAKNAKGRAAAVREMLPELASAEGLIFAPGAEDIFIARAGTDVRTLVSELAKLHTYLLDQNTTTITAQHISAITSPGGEEPDLWELTDGIDKRNAAMVLNLLNRLDGEMGSAIMVATMVEKHFRELLIVRDAVDRGVLTVNGWSPKADAALLEIFDTAGFGPNTEKRAWILRNRVYGVKSWTMNELRVARARAVALREAVVSGMTFEGLKTALLRIISKC